MPSCAVQGIRKLAEELPVAQVSKLGECCCKGGPAESNQLLRLIGSRSSWRAGVCGMCRGAA